MESVDRVTNRVHIFGTGGFAKETYTMCHRVGLYPIDFVDMYNVGYKIYDLTTIHDSWVDYSVGSIVAIGDPNIRYKICQKIVEVGGKFETVIDPTVTFTSPGTFFIGAGPVICPGVIITTDVIIGEQCHINMGAIVAHDVTIGDYTTISPSVTICGNVTIGKKCFIGAGASIRERINICDNVIIGMGAVVVGDITEPGVYVGCPARRIK